ncbi:MAG: hypothetical protein JWQ02_3314 [Capsulimonas sp.]|nr:hypothetical protein [Capsulimonas sp.]
MDIGHRVRRTRRRFLPGKSTMRIESSMDMGRPSFPGAALGLIGGLSRLVQDKAASVLAGAAPTPTDQRTTVTLTAEMLRTELLSLGAPATAQNMDIAKAFTQLGLPLNLQTIANAHASLAAAPGALPMAFALARANDLPTSPAALRALSTIINGIPASKTLPPEVMQWLALNLEAGSDPESLAQQLHLQARQIGQSTENRILKALKEGAAPHVIRDQHSTLLGIAATIGDRNIRNGADALASHIEGQQLLNQAAGRAHDAPANIPMYLAMPLQFPGEQTMVEMHLTPWDDDAEGIDDMPDDTAYLKATIRLTTTRLGLMEFILSGTLEGRLACHVHCEKPATTRLFTRQTAELSQSLAALGWPASTITCATRAEWTPLWHGGEALVTPRACVDWRV